MKSLYSGALYCLLLLIVVFFLIDYFNLKSVTLLFIIYTGVFLGFQYASMKQGNSMKSVFLLSLYAAVGYMMFQYLYVYVIDPEYVTNLSKSSALSLQERGYDDEEIERSMKMVGGIFNNVTIPIWGFIGSLLQLLAGFLIVFFIKRVKEKS